MRYMMSTAASGITGTGAAPAFLTGAAGALPSRTVAVLEAIKHAILTGELRPGQPLVETDLAEVLGVSKTPVREALKTLAGAGLVTMSPYKGAAVRVADNQLARHVYDARLLIEPEALARSVRPGRDWQQAHQALAGADSAAATNATSRVRLMCSPLFKMSKRGHVQDVFRAGALKAEMTLQLGVHLIGSRRRILPAYLSNASSFLYQAVRRTGTPCCRVDRSAANIRRRDPAGGNSPGAG